MNESHIFLFFYFVLSIWICVLKIVVHLNVYLICGKWYSLYEQGLEMEVMFLCYYMFCIDSSHICSAR